MEKELFYSFKEKIRLTRIFVSILLIGSGYAIYSIQESFYYYWFVYAFLLSATGTWYLFINLKSYFGRRPGLYLRLDSLFVKTSSSSLNIKWGDIKSFACFNKGTYSFVSVILFDENKILQQTNFYLKWIRKRSLKKYGTSIPIPVNFYNVSRTELLAELNYRLEK